MEHLSATSTMRPVATALDGKRDDTIMQHFEWPVIPFDTAVMNPSIHTPMNLFDLTTLDVTTDEMAATSARHGNKAVKAHCSSMQTQQQQHQPAALWSSSQVGDAFNLQRNLIQGQYQTQSGLAENFQQQQQQQPTYSDLNAASSNYRNDDKMIRDVYSQHNFTVSQDFFNTNNHIQDTNLNSGDLWQRRSLTRQPLYYQQPFEDDDIVKPSADYQWHDHSLQSSLIGSDITSSAQFCTPSPRDSTNSWSSAHPNLISSPNFQSLRQTPNWINQQIETIPSRSYENYFMVPDSLDMLHSASNITSTTVATGTTGLGLSLETSPTLSSSNTSYHSADEKQQQGEQADDKEDKMPFQFNDLGSILKETTPTKGKSNGGSNKTAAPRSKWQLNKPKSKKKKKSSHIVDKTDRGTRRRAGRKTAAATYKDDSSEFSSEEEKEEEELRYTCPFPSCDKDFSTSGHARRHSRIHTNQRPFICPHKECNSTFTRRDNCTQHQRSNHRSSLPAYRISQDS
jgi:hypothetical protein